MANNRLWGLKEYIEPEGKLVLVTPHFDVDSFPTMGDLLVDVLSAEVKERQFDADLHSWLIDFEGSLFFLRAEHYSESVWLEPLYKEESRDVAVYLAGLFRKGF